ncbi:uncharacterized protein [Battus philenor]|uniref:uncharacterized protein n=1 Tax=Battus philenor TaxID=42288 RepID=UPI0035D0AEFC
MDYVETRHSTKKAKRVRSWYLYEQYKSLENNQIHGAQALKDKSCQEKILHQELEERRVRRHLCDQSGISQSECGLPKGINSDAGTLASASTDDFIDNFCDFQETEGTVVNLDESYSLTLNQSRYDKSDNGAIITYSEESSNSTEKEIDINSDVKTDLEVVKQNIEENIQLQLETIENIQCLERYGKQRIEDKTAPELLSVLTVKQNKVCSSAEYDNSLYAIWSRLVSFAYQLIRLNRGNCYYEYSSQFMVAVLVCDVLCKGLNRMCDILQPFVSPIKFDESDVSTVCQKKLNHNESMNSLFLTGITKNKTPLLKLKSSRKKGQRRNGMWRRFARNSNVKMKNSKCCAYVCKCQPLHGVDTLSKTNKIVASIRDSWSEYNRQKHLCNHYCKAPSLNKIVNPMVELSRYIDSVLKDLDD